MVEEVTRGGFASGRDSGPRERQAAPEDLLEAGSPEEVRDLANGRDAEERDARQTAPDRPETPEVRAQTGGQVPTRGAGQPPAAEPSTGVEREQMAGGEEPDLGTGASQPTDSPQVRGPQGELVRGEGIPDRQVAGRDRPMVRDRVADRRAGLEADEGLDPAIQRGVEGLEAQIQEETPFDADPRDYRIVREGDQLRAELTDRGVRRFRIAQRREQAAAAERQFAETIDERFEHTDISPDDVRVRRVVEGPGGPRLDASSPELSVLRGVQFRGTVSPATQALVSERERARTPGGASGPAAITPGRGPGPTRQFGQENLLGGTPRDPAGPGIAAGQPPSGGGGIGNAVGGLGPAIAGDPLADVDRSRVREEAARQIEADLREQGIETTVDPEDVDLTRTERGFFVRLSEEKAEQTGGRPEEQFLGRLTPGPLSAARERFIGFSEDLGGKLSDIVPGTGLADRASARHDELLSPLPDEDEFSQRLDRTLGAVAATSPLAIVGSAAAREASDRIDIGARLNMAEAVVSDPLALSPAAQIGLQADERLGISDRIDAATSDRIDIGVPDRIDGRITPGQGPVLAAATAAGTRGATVGRVGGPTGAVVGGLLGVGIGAGLFLASERRREQRDPTRPFDQPEITIERDPRFVRDQPELAVDETLVGTTELDVDEAEIGIPSEITIRDDAEPLFQQSELPVEDTTRPASPTEIRLGQLLIGREEEEEADRGRDPEQPDNPFLRPDRQPVDPVRENGEVGDEIAFIGRPERKGVRSIGERVARDGLELERERGQTIVDEWFEFLEGERERRRKAERREVRMDETVIVPGEIIAGRVGELEADASETAGALADIDLGPELSFDTGQRGLFSRPGSEPARAEPLPFGRERERVKSRMESTMRRGFDLAQPVASDVESRLGAIGQTLASEQVTGSNLLSEESLFGQPTGNAPAVETPFVFEPGFGGRRATPRAIRLPELPDSREDAGEFGALVGETGELRFEVASPIEAAGLLDLGPTGEFDPFGGMNLFPEEPRRRGEDDRDALDSFLF